MPAQISLRDLAPGGLLFVPPTLKAGNYELSVAMLDPLTLQPCIRLAIQGAEDDDWYFLGKIQVGSGTTVLVNRQ